MVREIKVRDASISADINGRHLHIEIRTSKDTRKGFAIWIDGNPLIDADIMNGRFIDNPKSDKTMIFWISSVSKEGI